MSAITDQNTAAPVTDKSRASHRLPGIVGVVVLGLVAVAWIYPFLWMLSASLKTTLELMKAGANLWPDKFMIENYVDAWVDGQFGQYLANSVIVTLTTVAVVVIRCALCGYVLGRFSFKGSKVIIGVLVVTLFAPTGFTIIPIVQLSHALGLMNSHLGMILALSGTANVSAILIYAGYFRKLPRELEESAVIDGAGFLTVFARIMLPLSWPVTATVALLTFLGTWNAFLLPLVFTLGRPDLQTLSVGMQTFSGTEVNNWPGMAAGGVIAFIPIIAMFIFLQKFFVEGIAGAVKS